MKKTIFSLAVALSVGFVACNNESTETSSTDSTSMTTSNDIGSYAAMADSFRVNSDAGNYMDAKSGKSVKLNMDTKSGAVTNAETGEPVWRYVDRRNWWVYGWDNDNWRQMGSAKMQNDKLMYQDAMDTMKWVDYDMRWKNDDMKMEEDWKKKFGDTKIKISKDGDIKIKNEEGKVKYNADKDELKVDTSG